MPLLGVNIDHVATLRQARKGLVPDPLRAALIAEQAGADSIVAHLREDRRHINDRDIADLRRGLKSKFNMEMSIAPDIVGVACTVRPDQSTLVPERRKELTTEGGLDVALNLTRVSLAAERLAREGIGVSLFIDPEKKQIDAAKKCGVRMIELHTGRYADAVKAGGRKAFFRQIASAVDYARRQGIHVYAGHGLDYQNAAAIAGIPGVEELNIGYSIICRAVFVGLPQAVKEMKRLISIV